jgi:hypothetical protein
MASRSSRIFNSLILFQFLGCITNGPTKDPPRTVGPSFTDKHLDYQKWKRTRECCTAQGMKVAIASGGTFSSKCGEKILDGGGNLIDAAVATAFCLAVERPHSVSIAGGGFMLIHLADSQDIFLDFRETAPAAATQKMFLDRHGEEIPDLNRNGILAVGTPGFIAGLYKAQTTYGKLKGQSGWRKVIQPAVELARNGFPIYPSLVEKVERRKDILVKDTSLAKLLLPKGNPVRVGDTSKGTAYLSLRILENGRSTNGRNLTQKSEVSSSGSCHANPRSYDKTGWVDETSHRQTSRCPAYTKQCGRLAYQLLSGGTAKR